jgi:hypothetical protein
VDQRVEPPPWLPDGAAGSDTKGLASDDPVADGTDSDGPDSQGPGSFDSATHDAVGHDPGSYEPASYSSARYGSAGHDAVGHDPGSYDPASYSSARYGSAGHDAVGHDPGSYDPASYGSAGGSLGTQGSVFQSSAGDPPTEDVATDANAYSYAGEAFHPNGQDAAFGQEGAPVSAHGHESGLAGGAGNPPPYPAQVGGAAEASQQTGDTSRRTAVFSATPRKAKAGATSGRRADLVLARLEPWSVMKFSFLISLVAWVMLFVVVAVLWFALDSLGVFASVQKTLESVTSSSGSAGVSLTKWFSASRILGYTMLIGAVNIVLITALSTVGAMIYNLVTHLGGGIEVTLRQSD